MSTVGTAPDGATRHGLRRDFDFFIAHAGPDDAAAERLYDLLTPGSRPFLASRALRPGDDWDVIIADAQRHSAVTVVLVSRHTISAFYQREEIALAVDRSRHDPSRHRVVPIYLDGEVEVPYGLWIKHGIRVGEDGSLDDAAAHLLSLLSDASEHGQSDISPSARRAIPAPCPYKGLSAYGEADAELFFGRERLVDVLIARLVADRFVAVVGNSGCGKSSLVRAGLVPAVRAGRLPTLRDARVVVMTPGAQPLQSLSTLLSGADEEGASALATSLRQDPESFSTAASAAIAERDAGSLLLVIDQFEEVFTLCTDADERATFLHVLVAAAKNPRAATRLVAVLRADLYGHCAQDPGFASLVSGSQVLVGAMNDEELAFAIERPARSVGLLVEPALTAAVTYEASNRPALLPLISHALLQTWALRAGSTLTATDLRQAGGVAGAIAATAESFYAALDIDGQLALRDLFLELVAPLDGPRAARRRISRRMLVQRLDAPVADMLVDKAIAARLLSIDEDGEVELTHEAIVGSWPRLETWLDEGRSEIMLRRRIEDDAAAWLVRDRDPAYLYRGSQLGAARALRGLSGERRDLVTASVRADRRRKIIGAASLACALVVAVVPLTLFVSDAIADRAMRAAKARASAPLAIISTGSETFAIDRHEVSLRQYQECVHYDECSPLDPPPTDMDLRDPQPHLAEDRAVVWIRGVQAYAFCRWIGRSLPSASQWVAMVESPETQMLWTRAELRAREGARLPPEVVETRYVNFGNVTEWTRTPAPEVAASGDLPARVELYGLSRNDLVEAPYLLDDRSRWILAQGSADTTDWNSDLGFRCVATS
jgi:hypothetical protein